MERFVIKPVICQQTDQSVTQYAIAVVTWLDQENIADHRDTEHLHRLRLRYFVCGLEASLQQAVLMRSPQNYRQAYAAAIEWEALTRIRKSEINLKSVPIPSRPKSNKVTTTLIGSPYQEDLTSLENTEAMIDEDNPIGEPLYEHYHQEKDMANMVNYQQMDAELIPAGYPYEDPHLSKPQYFDCWQTKREIGKPERLNSTYSCSTSSVNPSVADLEQKVFEIKALGRTLEKSLKVPINPTRIGKEEDDSQKISEGCNDYHPDPADAKAPSVTIQELSTRNIPIPYYPPEPKTVKAKAIKGMDQFRKSIRPKITILASQTQKGPTISEVIDFKRQKSLF